MKKKVVWLPYDLDTAVGINNEGALVFGYELEDTDQTESGADVYNGQDSVVWNNIRMAFHDELAAMYKTLRSTGALSYAKVEEAFENHQSKWPETIFNEDAWFKYIQPLTENGSGAYLAMLQGSKEQQRKWWLYNRFRYIDSKYNAGDALSDLIQIRGYAKANVTITPYADIYPTVKYGSYLVQERGHRNVATTLTCPLDNVNDTEIYIYSASQLSSVGDLSGFKIGFADFSMATKLQELKVGSTETGYENANLGANANTFTLGNNVLLKKLEMQNCVAFGTGNQKTLDISGCTNIEEVYLDGTALQGVTLPNGGVLKKLHVPGTLTNLTIINQPQLSEFVMPSYSNISSLRLENVGSAIDMQTMLMAIPATSRVRLIGIDWECDDTDEIDDLFDQLDLMRGLDENGNNMESAQISGTIHVPSITGAKLEEYNSRYGYIDIEYDHITSYLKYYTWDGGTLLYSEAVNDGGDGGTYSGQPTREATERASYSFIGWSLSTDSTQVDANWYKAVTTDRKVYAAYSVTGLTYLKYYNYDGSELLYTETIQNGGDGGTYTGQPARTATERAEYTFVGWNSSQDSTTNDPNCTKTVSTDRDIYAAYSVTNLTYLSYYTYDGSELLTKQTIRNGGNGTYSGTPARASTAQFSYTFVGWNRNIYGTSADATATQGISADRSVYAAYSATVRTYTVYFYNGSTLLQTIQNVQYGASATYTGATPVHSDPENYVFNGWEPAPNNISGNTTCQVKWKFIGSKTRQTLDKTIKLVNSSDITSVGDYTFAYCSSITTVSLPAATTIGDGAFYSCNNIKTLSIPLVTTIGERAFEACRSLTEVNLPLASSIGDSAFQFCENINTVNLPTATFIGSSAFIYCYAITSLNIPNATAIGGSAFYSCIELSALNLPSATSIGQFAFEECRKLATVSLPVATTIAAYAFDNCSSLTNVSLPVATSIGQAAFRSCRSLTSVYLPVATTIGSNAFGNCSILTGVSLPVATSIGSGAFYYCNSLSELYVLASSICTLGNTGALSYTPMSLSSYLGYFGSIYVPESLVNAYKTATNWSVYSARITAYTGE